MVQPEEPLGVGGIGFPLTAVTSGEPGLDVFCPLAGAGVPGLMAFAIIDLPSPPFGGVQNANSGGQC